MHKTDKTYLHINGKLRIKGKYSIGRGCRFDIGENAVVTIGNGGYMNCNVKWIGCGVKIYKGTVIPNGCVIASDSIVKGVFHVENSLIGGNPAKVIKEGITWQ